MISNANPAKAKNSEKLNVLWGSADSLTPLRDQLMGAEGLESFSPNMEKHGGNAVKDSHAKIPGVQVGAIDSDSDSQRQFKQQALDDLQRAWKSIRRMESLSDDPAESKVARRALAFVDRAFEELEGGKR